MIQQETEGEACGQRNFSRRSGKGNKNPLSASLSCPCPDNRLSGGKNSCHSFPSQFCIWSQRRSLKGRKRRTGVAAGIFRLLLSHLHLYYLYYFLMDTKKKKKKDKESVSFQGKLLSLLLTSSVASVASFRFVVVVKK